ARGYRVAVVIVGGQAAFGFGGRPEPEDAAADPIGRRERDFIEQLPVGLLLLDGNWGHARVGEIGILAPGNTPGSGGKEEQLVLHEWATEGIAHFVMVIRVLPILNVAHGSVVDWIEQEAANRAGADAIPGIVVVNVAVERVTAGLRDGADHAAQCAAVLGIDTAGLDLHFLQN